MLVLATVALAAAQQTSNYGEQQEITAPLPDPSSIRAADVDGDGDLDVVCASRELESIFWFENEGGGVIGQRHLVSSGLGWLIDLDVGDVDDDGDIDIVVTVAWRDVWLLRNDGSPSFGATQLLAGGGSIGSNITLFDVDGDGDTDLLVASEEGFGFGSGVVLFEALGGGVFAPAQFMFGLVADLAPMDVDGDGILDLVAAGPGPMVSWLRRPSGQGFWTVHPIGPSFLSTSQVELVDLDGDGDRDIVTASRASRSVVIYENLGPGSFGPEVVIGGSDLLWPRIALLDVDQDGDTDVIVGEKQGGGPHWLENLGAFQFVRRSDLVMPPFSGVQDLDLADLDGDGHRDLLMTNGATGALWLPGATLQPSGVVFQAATRPINAIVEGARSLAALDIDADGDLDIVGASRVDGLSLAINRGAGQFEPPRALPFVTSGCDWLSAGDLDTDGDEDLAYRDSGGQVGWLENTGSGTFGALTIIDLWASPSVFGPLLVDIEGDGDLDIVVGPDPGDIVAYDQVSPGVFGPARTIASVPDRVLEIIASDVDSDGTLDLVYVTGPGTVLQVEWVRGAGGGTFLGGGVIASGREVLGLKAVDLNLDGNVDVFWLRPAASELVVAWGSGAGTFTAPLVAVSHVGRGEALLLDRSVVGIPWIDLLIAHRSASALTSEVQRFHISGINVFPANVITDGVDVVTQLITADVDGDGFHDVVSSSHSDGKLAWYSSSLGGVLGVSYCGPAAVNSTGGRASIRAVGRSAPTFNTVSLQAFDLPSSATTLFLTSRTSDLVAGPGGSQGTLCLGGAIGRFGGPGQVGAATPDGFRQISIDLTALPLPTGSTSVFAGELWQFQAWFRDQVGGVATSNFTDATAVVFL